MTKKKVNDKLMKGFTNGSFEGFLKTDASKEHPVAKSFIKLGTLLPKKEAYDLSVFLNTIHSDPKCTAYVDEKEKVIKKMNAFWDEIKTAKEEELKSDEKIKANESEISAMAQRYSRSQPPTEELRQELNDLTALEIDLGIEKHSIQMDKVKEYEFPENASVEDMKTIREWNFSEEDFRNVEPYIEFIQ